MKALKPFWMSWFKKRFSRWMKELALILIEIYRCFFSAHLGGACRFSPSCSAFAQQTIKTQPLGRALTLILKRILACRPGGRSGYDPPSKDNK